MQSTQWQMWTTTVDPQGSLQPPLLGLHHHHLHLHHHYDQSNESNDDVDDNLVDEAHEVVVSPPSLAMFVKIFQYL